MMMISRLPTVPLRRLTRAGSVCQILPSSSVPVATQNQTPLFLRPLIHKTTLSHLHTFRNWAKQLAVSSSHPDPSHLVQELKWLLQDATSNNHAELDGTSPNLQVLMRAELEELYGMWKERVEERKPFQYIVGCEHWRDMVLVVGEGVLIPRPETEMLVELVRQVEGFRRDGLWADLGTGSGAIAVGIGRLLGDGGRVLGTDLSEVAVQVARINVERYGLKDRVEIRQGSWFEPLKDVVGMLDGLVSNPPYIPTNDIRELQEEVGRYEPHLALDGGEDGLSHLLHLCDGCCEALKPGGFFAFETNGDKHSELIAELMNERWRRFFCDIKVIADFYGVKRFITGFRSSS